MHGKISLLFVYNLDSRILESLHDYSSGKGITSEKNVCPLSTLTHSPVGIKKEWKRFVKDLTIPSRDLAKNEFTAEFGARPITFPVVILKKEEELTVLASAEEIGRCAELGGLITILEERLHL